MTPSRKGLCDTAAMFDLMADGQWHDFEKVRDVGAMAYLAEHWDDSLERGRAILANHDVPDWEIALSGAKDRTRNALMVQGRKGRVLRETGVRNGRAKLTDQAIAAWVKTRSVELQRVTDAAEALHAEGKDRVFGGMSERVAFACVPLRNRARIVFDVATGELPLATLQVTGPLASTEWELSFDDDLGEYVLEGPEAHAPIMRAAIEDLYEETGFKAIKIKSRATRRRSLHDLDPSFREEAIVFYQRFLNARLTSSWSTVSMFIPDWDDQQQQMALWTMKAMRMFDETRNVPFGAYLLERARRWVYDLPRAVNGRVMADHTARRGRAMTSLTQQLGREPSSAELAEELGIDIKTYRLLEQQWSNYVHLSDPVPIDGGVDGVPHEVASAATTPAASGYSLDAAEAAELTATLLNACLASSDPDIGIIALAHMYQTSYGNRTGEAAAQMLDIDLRDAQAAVQSVAPRIAAALEG